MIGLGFGSKEARRQRLRKATAAYAARRDGCVRRFRKRARAFQRCDLGLGEAELGEQLRAAQ